MRTRLFREMLRDSRVGSIIIAKSIAIGLLVFIQPLTWPLERVVAPLVNFVAVRGFHRIAPFSEGQGIWGYLFLSQAEALLISAFWFGFAYLFAAWLYKPSPAGSGRKIGIRVARLDF